MSQGSSGYYEQDSAAAPWNAAGAAPGLGWGAAAPLPTFGESAWTPYADMPEDFGYDLPQSPDGYIGQQPYSGVGMPPASMASSLGPNGETGIPVQPVAFGGAPTQGQIGQYGAGYQQFQQAPPQQRNIAA